MIGKEARGVTTDLSRADWRISARSTGSTTCLEAALLESPGSAPWKVSARSNGSSTCVEATTDGATVAVRNSNDPAGPALRVSGAGWLTFLDHVATGRLDYDELKTGGAGPFHVSRAADGMVELTDHARADGVVVRYTRLEWDVFVKGVTIDGEFTLDWLLKSPQASSTN